MSDQHGLDLNLPDPVKFSETMNEIMQRSQKLALDFVEKNPVPGFGENPDPLNITDSFAELTRRLYENPTLLIQAQMQFWNDYMGLWQNAAQGWLGSETDNAPFISPEKGDRRFRDPLWSDLAVYDFIKQSYLLTARWLLGVVSTVDGLAEADQRKVEFYTKQFIDALSPSNFAATNPEVLRATLESGGTNLLMGFRNLLADLENGKGISMTQQDAFSVGENIAATPGKVVFRNPMMELIQFAPSTAKVYKTPLLIVPPWINKYYILDLRAKNSFIRWAVDQGHTVFVISWINPDDSYADKGFADYMNDGPLAALDAIEQATGEKQANLIGYCLGGTLSAATLAYMAAKGDDWFKSATFFAALTDFKDAGDLQIFIDEVQLQNLEDKMDQTGFLDGSEMATTFNMLRANDLIWSFVINNYLLGKDAFPFDLLYWNTDSTRMPAAMHAFYLRKMYLENKLSEPGGITLNGEGIDLRKVATPSYIISTHDDHIAPWKCTYEVTQLFKGPVRFVLSASGHIAGIINPPAAEKYHYWTNDSLPADADDWFAGAAKNPHSWWPDWINWVKAHAGGRRTTPAREPGTSKLKALDDAPGTYVRVRV